MTPKMKAALEILDHEPIIVTMDSVGMVTAMSVSGVDIRTLRALENRDLVRRRLLSLSKDIFEKVA